MQTYAPRSFLGTEKRWAHWLPPPSVFDSSLLCRFFYDIIQIFLFFLMTNRKSANPPPPRTATEPTTMPAISPPESLNFLPHSSHLPSVFSLPCSAGVLSSPQVLQVASQALSYLCPSAFISSILACALLCVQVKVLTPFAVQVGLVVISPSFQECASPFLCGVSRAFVQTDQLRQKKRPPSGGLFFWLMTVILIQTTVSYLIPS